MSSVSRIKIAIQISTGGQVDAEFHRHLAPTTVAALVEKRTLDGYVVKFENQFIYIQVGLILGAEKSRRKFVPGEIAFIPSTGSLAFFLQQSTSLLPMNPIGKIISGTRPLESLKPGTRLRVRVED